MVDVLVILDGASEPLLAAGAPTSLERARTPLLDRLASEGELTRLRTVAPWPSAGSEVAIPALLGWTSPSAVDRGAIEAAAHAIGEREGQRAWRVDVLVGVCVGFVPHSDAFSTHRTGLRRPSEADVARGAAGLRAAAPLHAVRRLGGHRLLVVGPEPLPPAARAPGLRVWEEGVVPPAILGEETVVVHAGGPDEAAHVCDGAAKVAAIERADRDLLAPLLAAIAAAGGTLRVCPDHGCDPATGTHDAEPVPCVTWSPRHAVPRAAVPRHALLRDAVPQDVAPGRRRLTERAVAGLPIAELASATTLAVVA